MGKDATELAEKSEASTDKLRRVFVVHGRDERLRSGVFTFLRSLGLEPLEWTKAIELTGNASPYIGQILDAAFAYAQAVVVLLTPDDLAKLREDLLLPEDPTHERTLTGQARANVLFEAGMAFASHPNQTVLVQFGQVRPFSDVAGRHVVKMVNSVPKRQEFALKLRTAGCSIDLDGTDWHTSGDLTSPTQSAENSRTQANNERVRPPEPNLVLMPGIRMGTLYLRYDHWSETTLPEFSWQESQHKAIWAEIKNKSGSRPIGSVNDVRAELIIGDDEFSPLSWIDNEFNLVKFDFGASQFVVLTVEMPGDTPGDWRIPISRRDYDYPSGLRALYLDNFVKLTTKKAPVRLNLLHVSAGKVLKRFRGVATWRQNMPWFTFH